MRHVVKAKQPNSKMCLVCGLHNAFGLHAFFYELENDELLAIFRPREDHQGYPGRLHGGIASAILDETIGRSIMMRYEQEVWGVTLEFTTHYKRPIPPGEEVRVVGRVTNEASRTFEGSAEILLKDGRVAATGHGKYMKLPIEQIADFDMEAQEWKVVPARSDPVAVEF